MHHRAQCRILLPMLSFHCYLMKRGNPRKLVKCQRRITPLQCGAPRYLSWFRTAITRVYGRQITIVPWGEITNKHNVNGPAALVSSGFPVPSPPAKYMCLALFLPCYPSAAASESAGLLLRSLEPPEAARQQPIKKCTLSLDPYPPVMST